MPGGFNPANRADFHTHWASTAGPSTGGKGDFATVGSSPQLYGLKHYVVDAEGIKRYWTDMGVDKSNLVWSWSKGPSK